MATTASAKICIACGKDVTNAKRMKDSEGRYWCVDCGTADLARRKAGKVGVAGGGLCASCREQYPEHKLTKFGKDKLCPKCIQARTKSDGLIERLRGMFSGLRGGGGGGGGGQTGKGRLIGMLVLVALLLVLAIWMNTK